MALLAALSKRPPTTENSLSKLRPGPGRPDLVEFVEIDGTHTPSLQSFVSIVSNDRVSISGGLDESFALVAEALFHRDVWLFDKTWKHWKEVLVRSPHRSSAARGFDLGAASKLVTSKSFNTIDVDDVDLIA